MSATPRLSEHHGDLGTRPAAIACDIDGTLLNSEDRLSLRTRDVLRRAADDGTVVLLATGRPSRWIYPVIEQLGFGPQCVCSNGAVLYDAGEDSILDTTLLSSETLTHLVRITESVLPDVGFAIDAPPDVGKSRVPGIPREGFFADESFAHVWLDPDPRVIPREQLLSEPAIKLLIRNHEMTSAEMARVLTPLVEDYAALTFSVEAGLIELSAPGLSKAVGLSSYLTDLGMDGSDLVAFGDMPNDVAMLRFARLGVAMGNAHPLAQEAADLITESNDDDGIAEVLERWWP